MAGNSGGFDSIWKEGDISDDSLDVITPALTIDDKVLQNIFRNLYWPHSPYQFSVLSTDILGQIYERFLGKRIRLDDKNKVHIEEKPEAIKAGGVYYTPTYIVNYIVNRTLGKVLAGKKAGPRNSPDSVSIIDPACGSGSFLLRAYQYLLDWYLDQYSKSNPAKMAKARNPRVSCGPNGEWRLTLAERKRILLTHIYGVDIDRQAVEVTKLSLLLKALEGETRETLSTQLQAFAERALPDLSRNIKCGNSLIGPDYFNARQTTFLDPEILEIINSFDWNSEFPEIMNEGGFTVVIGNPPYLNIDDTWGMNDERQRYIKKAYSYIYNDKTDILFYFLAKALHIGREEIGFIVSRAFLEAYKADKLRGWLPRNCNVRNIIDFRNYYVFRSVGITTAIVLLSKAGKSDDVHFYRFNDTKLRTSDMDSEVENTSVFQHITVPHSRLTEEPWTFADDITENLLQKIDAGGQPLGTILIVGQGMQTGRNKVFDGHRKAVIEQWGLKKGQYYARARNSDIYRYYIDDNQTRILYFEDEKRLSDIPLPVQQYMKSHKKELMKRAAYQRNDCEWWQYTWPLHKQYINRSKLYCPYLAKSNRFALNDEGKYLGLTDTTVIYDNKQKEKIEYLLGLLNSKVLTFRFQHIGKLKSGGILEYFWNSISKLPLYRIDFDKPSEVKRHDAMVRLVRRISKLCRKVNGRCEPRDKVLWKREIEATDQEIDELVYEIYQLNADDIKFIESRVAHE